MLGRFVLAWNDWSEIRKLVMALLKRKLSVCLNLKNLKVMKCERNFGVEVSFISDNFLYRGMGRRAMQLLVLVLVTHREVNLFAG